MNGAIDRLRELERAVPKMPGSIQLDGDTIVIDNPGARGALTVQMMIQLAEIVGELSSTSLGVVVLRGTEGSFCSGGHLGQVRAGLVASERGRQMCEAMTLVLDGLATLPCLVVAAVDGPARGGGAELLTAVDHRVFSPRGSVGFVQARLGITPGWGATARLIRLLGPTQALRWLSTGTVRTAEELGWFADARGLFPETLDRFLEPLQGLEVSALHAVKQAVLAESPVGRTGGEGRVFATRWGGRAHRDALGL